MSIVPCFEIKSIDRLRDRQTPKHQFELCSKGRRMVVTGQSVNDEFLVSEVSENKF